MNIAAYPKYESYKNGASERLDFPVPSHWSTDKARFLFKFNKGLTITKENLEDEGIPCVNYGEIHSKFGFAVDPAKHALKCVSLDYLKANSGSILRRGDFVFADTSEDIEGSGNFTHLDSDEVTFAGYHTVIARPESRAQPRYLAYMLDSAAFRRQVQKAVKGVKVFSISQGLLKNLEVLLPPLPEQSAIATFLDGKSAGIDEAVRIKEAQIKLLAERRQILIQQAVTRGLNPAAPMKDSGIDWIGQIPAHWEVRRSKFLFRQSRQLARQDDIQLSATQSYGVIPQEKFEELVGRRVVKISTNLEKRKHVELNDFVISMRSFQGGLERAYATGCIRSSYVILRPEPEVNADFFGYLLKTPRYIHALQITGNFIRDGQDLTFENFTDVDLYVPPYQEQAEIAEYIKGGCERIDNAILIKKDQIAALKEYKTSMINAAVTGKIKVI